MKPQSLSPSHQHGPFMDLGEFDKVDMIESPMFDRQVGLQMQMHPVYVNHRVVGTGSLVAIMYLFLSAGPIGSEEMYSAGGPLYGLLGNLIYSLLIAVPYAWIVAELCSAFPEDGGFTVWVMNAFGPFWGFQVGYWSWIAGTLRGALVPGTLVKIVLNHYDITIDSTGTMFAIKAAVAIVLAIPVVIGSRSIARLSIVIMAFVLLAFSVFTLWGLSTASDSDDLTEVRHENTTYNPDTKDVEVSGSVSIEWGTFLNVLFYKYKGMNNASVFGGEIRNPARAYSTAIATVMGLMVVTYTLPMTAGLISNNINWDELNKDSFPSIALEVGGDFLNELIVVAACCGTAGMYMAALYVKAFLLSGMADNQLVPEVIGKRHSRFQSPVVAIGITLVTMLPLVNLDFDDMLPMTNAYSAAIQLLILAAIVTLRRRLPYIPRPTKVPGGVTTLLVLAVFPTFMFGYITFYAFTNWVSIVLIGGFLVPGLAYGAYRFFFHRSLA